MEEPSALMRWIMFHFAGGDALFIALLAGAVLSVWPDVGRSPWRGTFLTLVAMIWGAFSSPAWPIPMIILFLAVIVVWRIDRHLSPSNALRTIPLWFFVQSGILIAGFGELVVRNNSWQPKRQVPQQLDVIADSITAGLNDGEVTWPRLYAERTGIPVRDASQPGATLKSALQQAELLDGENPLILEIGGNDLLSGLSVDQFSTDCEVLLKRVSVPGRTVWMTELPLPPLCSRYGETQRRLCRRYGVRLIPKRRWMSLLTTQGATVDSIHLSSRGQIMLCNLMLRITGRSANAAATAGTYERLEHRRN